MIFFFFTCSGLSPTLETTSIFPRSISFVTAYLVWDGDKGPLVRELIITGLLGLNNITKIYITINPNFDIASLLPITYDNV